MSDPKDVADYVKFGAALASGALAFVNASPSSSAWLNTATVAASAAAIFLAMTMLAVPIFAGAATRDRYYGKAGAAFLIALYGSLLCVLVLALNKVWKWF